MHTVQCAHAAPGDGTLHHCAPEVSKELHSAYCARCTPLYKVMASLVNQLASPAGHS